MNELESLARRFAEGLAVRYGLRVLAKIDEANKLVDTNIYDAVYDYIDMCEYFQEYIKACGMIGVDWHNPNYAKVFRMLPQDGYVSWGD